MARRRPVLLSASRRTDLPGWHAEGLATRLQAALDREGADGVYGLVLWTRFPGALLRPPLLPLLEGPLRNTAVNLTVTGLGGSTLEPGAPDTAEVLDHLEPLVALLGDPARLRWRFDPLVPTDDLLARFERLADVFSELAVPTCTFAFPAARSLRGDLRRRYQDLRVPEWPDETSRRETVCALVERATPRAIQLLSCAQPEVLTYHPAVQQAQCIPGDLLAAAHPADAPAPRGKDRTQRRHCSCPPSTDLGDYRTDVCRSGCLYCYSTLGGPDGGETVPWFLRGRL